MSLDHPNNAVHTACTIAFSSIPVFGLQTLRIREVYKAVKMQNIVKVGFPLRTLLSQVDRVLHQRFTV